MDTRPGYHDVIGRMYDLFNPVITPEEVARLQTNFVLHFALKAGAAIDVGAGTGRLAIPLAERGIRVHCVEPSRGMLDAMVIKATQKPNTLAHLTPVVADATSFKLGIEVPFIYMCWSFFGLTNDDERLKALKNIHSHLTADGVFLVDQGFGSDDADVPLTEVGRVTVGDLEYRMLREDKVVAPKVIQSRLVFEIWQKEKDVKLDTVEGGFRYGDIRRERFMELLHEAGFTVKHALSNYKFTSLFNPEKDDNLVVVAQKR